MRAATELAVLVLAQIEQRITDRQWSGYQHQFAGNATRAERTTADIDFDSPLMRLAAGGRTPAGGIGRRVIAFRLSGSTAHCARMRSAPAGARTTRWLAPGRFARGQ